MRFSLVAVLGAVAFAYAEEAAVDSVDVNDLYAGPLAIPEGLAKPPPKQLPKKGHGPPKGAKPVPVWHPAHKGKPIDDCDDDDADDWHWGHSKNPVKPQVPHWKWTTSTVTNTKTVTKCPGGTPGCPDKDHVKTVTVEVTTTVCPVPVTKPGEHPPKPTPPGPGAPPPSPPKPTPPAPEGPPPPAVSKPPPGTIGLPPKPTPTSSRAVVTAGAAQNIQRAGGALAAVAAVAAALV